MVKSLVLVSVISAGAHARTAERLLDGSILMASLLLPLASILPLYAQHGRNGVRYARWVFVVAICITVTTILAISFLLFSRPEAAPVYLCASLAILGACLNLALMVAGKRKYGAMKS